MRKLFLISGILFLLSGLLYAEGRDTIRVSNIITSVRYELNDLDSSTAFWSNTVLRDFIKESLRDVAGMGAIIGWDTIVTIKDVTFYQLNSDFMDISPFNTSTGALIKTSTGWKALAFRAFKVSDAGDIPIGKDASRTQPAFYSVTNNYLILDPPSTAGGDTLRVFYEAFGTAITADSSTLNIPYEYKRLLVLGVLRRALLMNRENVTYQMMAQVIDNEYKDKYSRLYRRSEPAIMPVRANATVGGGQ
jgi:hypothetical protein